MPRPPYATTLGQTHRASTAATLEHDMTEQFPTRLATAIRERIAVLREAWDLHDGTASASPRVQDYPMSRPRRRRQ